MSAVSVCLIGAVGSTCDPCDLTGASVSTLHVLTYEEGLRRVFCPQEMKRVQKIGQSLLISF